MNSAWPRAALKEIVHVSAPTKQTRVCWIQRSLSSRWLCRQCWGYGHSPRTPAWRTKKFEDSRHELGKRISYPHAIARRKSTSSEQSSGRRDDANSVDREDLPSKKEGRRSNLSKRFSHVMDNVQSNIFIAGQRLNDLTGYSGIEALKKDIEEQENLVQETRASLRAAKEAYTNTISVRSASQREVNELLQRKHAWSPQDLERFTELYRSDHANEQAEAAAEKAMAAAEKAAEEAATRLNRSILARYHEEQIWSDKIRRMSTWGTWGLMGVNVLLFLVFQIGVEPWRRKRLVKGFEDKVMEALEKENTAHPLAPAPAVAIAIPAEAAGEVAGEEALVALPTGLPVVTADAFPNAGPLVSKDLKENEKAESKLEDIPAVEELLDEKAWGRLLRAWGSRIRDLFSEREVTVRRVDLTAKAIEGTFAGIAIVSLVGMILRGTR